MKTSNTLVLIQTPYIEGYGPMRRAAGTYFPLGLGYLAAMVKRAGFQVRFLDPNVQEIDETMLIDWAIMESPLLIGISFMTPQFKIAKRLCTLLRAAASDSKIVLGGAHPSVLPRETLLAIPAADFLSVGEGEETLPELLLDLQAGKNGETVLGLWRRDSGRIVENLPRLPIEDLDALPFPDRSIIDQSLYRPQSFHAQSGAVGTIDTSRGCPGRCTFCCSGSSLRRSLRERSIDNVMGEVDFLVEKYAIKYLLIRDDTFTMRRERVLEFCRNIAQRHPDIKWNCMGRVNTVDRDLLATMKSAGLHDIFFGIESGNEEILRRCRKGITKNQVRRAVKAADELGIVSYGAFILGLPGETRETALQTIEFACELPLTMAGFSIMTPYPGTESFQHYYQPPDDMEEEYTEFIASTGMHYVTGYTGLGYGLAPADLPALVSLAQKRFYLRPRQIGRMLRHATIPQLMGYARGFCGLVAKELFLRKKG
jgi:radical SAM superfamily enzyme YgiQ (UPF0313 family)